MDENIDIEKILNAIKIMGEKSFDYMNFQGPIEIPERLYNELVKDIKSKQEKQHLQGNTSKEQCPRYHKLPSIDSFLEV